MASERLDIILSLVTGNYKKEARDAATATGQIGTAAAKTGTQASSGFGKLSSSLAGVTKGFGAAAIAGIGLTVITSQLKAMADAAAEDAKSQATLAFAIRNNTDATDSQIESNERWITSMMLATNIADTDLRTAMQSLVVTGKSVAESQDIIAASADIAAARGKDFGAVIEAMVKAAATGSVAGLGRMGIATKDLNGDLLTLDEILGNVAATMGGSSAEAANTLAGAMERANTIMEEAAESGGAHLLTNQSKLNDAWAEWKTFLNGGNMELAMLSTTFNALIREGINPTENAVASMITVLTEMSERTDISADTMATLRLMVGGTDQDVRNARDAIQTYGEAWGLSEERIAELMKLLRDEAPGTLDEVHDSWDDLGESIRFVAGEVPKAIPVFHNLTTELQLAAEAGRNVQDVLLAATDPLFAAIDGWQSYQDAIKDANEDGKVTAEESLTLLREELEFLATMGQLDTAGYERAMEAILLSTDMTRTEIEALLTQLGLLDGKTFNMTVTANVKMNTIGNTSGGNPNSDMFRFAEGGVIPGATGDEKLILAHAGETVLPTHNAAFLAKMRKYRERITALLAERGARQSFTTYRNPGFLPSAMNEGGELWHAMFNPDGTWLQQGRGGRAGVPRFDQGGVVGQPRGGFFTDLWESLTEESQLGNNEVRTSDGKRMASAAAADHERYLRAISKSVNKPVAGGALGQSAAALQVVNHYSVGITVQGNMDATAERRLLTNLERRLTNLNRERVRS